MTSYRKVTDANADMLKKAEIMYRADAENTALTRGIGADELDRQESLKAINQKLNMLREEKAKALEDKEQEYNRDTIILQSLYDNEMKSKIVLEKQDRELNRNNSKLGNIKQDVLTLRRQVEIAQDETWRRNNKVFYLKTLLTWLLGIMIPLILVKNNRLSNKWAAIIVTAITVFFALILLWNIYHGQNRNSLRYNLRHWNSPKLSDIVHEEDEEEINDSLEREVERRRKKEKGETLKFIALIKQDLRRALRNKNYRDAAEYQEILDKLTLGLREGNSFGGFESLEALKNYIKLYNEKKASGRKEQRGALLKRMNELKMKHESKEVDIDSLNKDYKREIRETNVVKKKLRTAKKDIYNINKDIRMTQRDLNNYM